MKRRAAKACSVCAHPQRQNIEREVAALPSDDPVMGLLRISQRFRVTTRVLARHAKHRGSPAPGVLRRERVYREAPGVVVYFIRAGDAVKIGSTRDVQDRLKTLQIANAAELSLLLVVPGGLEVEGELHQRFAGYRIRGEWFALSEEISTFIEQQRAATP